MCRHPRASHPAWAPKDRHLVEVWVLCPLIGTLLLWFHSGSCWPISWQRWALPIFCLRGCIRKYRCRITLLGRCWFWNKGKQVGSWVRTCPGLEHNYAPGIINVWRGGRMVERYRALVGFPVEHHLESPHRLFKAGNIFSWLYQYQMTLQMLSSLLQAPSFFFFMDKYLSPLITCEGKGLRTGESKAAYVADCILERKAGGQTFTKGLLASRHAEALSISTYLIFV